MKTKSIIKYVLSLISSVIFEEILRTIINNVKDRLTMDKTFLITVPICLLLLLACWIYIYLKDKQEKEENILKLQQDKEKNILKLQQDREIAILGIIEEQNKEFLIYRKLYNNLFKMIIQKDMDKYIPAILADRDNGNISNEDLDEKLGLNHFSYQQYKREMDEKNNK